MTTKEFLRRSESYKTLDSAAGYFLTVKYDYIYHVEGGTFSGTRINIYQIHPYTHDLSSSFLNDCNWLCVTSFTKYAFDVQLGYFKGFLARLSSYQRSVLESSHKVDNLLKFCNEDSI